MSIPINLTADHERKLAEIAWRLGVAPDALAQAAVLELFATSDADLEGVTRRLLEKNRGRTESLDLDE
jgi:hypothetical protein